MAKHLNELVRRAVGMHQSGNAEAAINAYAKALAIAPDDSRILNLYGVACGQVGRTDEAVTSLELAAKLAPGDAATQQNLGLALINADRVDEAVQPLRMAIRLAPKMAQAHANLGNLYKQQKQFAEAAACYEEAVGIAPGDYKSWNNLGNTRRELKDLPAAEKCLRRALTIKPDFVEALSNLGLVLADAGRVDEALASYEKALELDSNNADLFVNYGNALREAGREEDASDAFTRAAVYLEPDNGGAWSSLGNSVLALGRIEHAGECYRRAVERSPENPAIHFNLALYQLLTGDLENGFAEYEWGLDGDMRQPQRPFRQARWRGEPFENETLLVYAEQGIGDMLQFVRFLPQVKALGGRVLLEVQQGVAPLLENLKGVDRIFERTNDGSVPYPFDRYVALLSLPTLLNVSLDSCNLTAPYLTVPNRFADTARTCIGDGTNFKIALSWYGNPEHKNDRNRSCPLAELAPLFDIPGTRWYALAPGERTQRDIDATGLPIHALSRPFPEAAALLNEMDLIISIDSAHAHLAGALGKPAWILLPFAPDWRWLLEREDTPWYPTMRLFRQTRRGDWGAVVEKLNAALAESTSGPTGTYLS